MIGHILCRNCLLKHVIEGRIKGRRDEEEDVTSYIKETRGYWKTERRCITEVPDLLPDVFCLMVRIFRLMLVLFYIYK